MDCLLIYIEKRLEENHEIQNTFNDWYKHSKNNYKTIDRRQVMKQKVFAMIGKVVVTIIRKKIQRMFD